MSASSPAITSGRAAAYFYLASLARSNAKERLTSLEASQALGVNQTQIRRDLSELLPRSSGRRGVGYETAELVRELGPQVVVPECGSAAALLVAAGLAGHAAEFVDDRVGRAVELARDLDHDVYTRAQAVGYQEPGRYVDER